MSTSESNILPIKKKCSCGCGRWLPDYVIGLHIGKEGQSVEEWLSDQGFTLEEIRARSNEPAQVEIRRRIAVFLVAHDWSHRRIGQFIARDRNTVRALLGLKKR